MEQNDIQHGIETAWHGLTVVKTAEELARDGFPFDYTKTPLLTQISPDKSPEAIPGWFWLAGSDDKALVGNPQFESFGYLTNAQLMEVVRETLRGTGATVASLGTFAGRTKRYVSIKVGSEWDQFKVGEREFQNYLNLQDALDGTMPLIAKGSSICQVCQNTFNLSLSERSDFRLSVRHSKNHALPSKIENFEQAITAYHGAAALFKRLMESAESVKVDVDTAKRVFAGYMAEGEKISTKSLNTVNRLVDLYQTGRGNKGETGADVLNAITDYYSHESSSTRGVMAQFTSSEMGAGARNKTEFFEAVSNRTPTAWTWGKSKVANLAEMGERSLALAALAESSN